MEQLIIIVSVGIGTFIGRWAYDKFKMSQTLVIKHVYVEEDNE